MHLDESIAREWLETNGIGGFACGTLSGIHTRRYHGLLIAALDPPSARRLLLSKFEETLLVGDQRFELSANLYSGGVVHPKGFAHLQSFRLDPWPVFVFRAGGVELEKRVFLVHGENTVVVEYALTQGGAASLELRPLIAFRDYHATTHENGALDRRVTATGVNSVSLRPYADLPRLYFSFSNGVTSSTGYWYRNFEYPIERDRGLDFQEDLFQPFAITCDVNTAVIVSVNRESTDANVQLLKQRERGRRASLLSPAADQFIVRRGSRGLHSIVAGYPWFTDWGRDTMISLPGLTLATGRPEIAKSILRTFAGAIDQGMLPNRFTDAGAEQAEYNTVDATLWFFEALQAYLDYTGDLDFARRDMYPHLADIIDWHERGTRFGIHVDQADGLLHCGSPGVQLTWMDAKVGDWVVTPRHGKPVEIQALWYNALRVAQSLAPDGKSQARYAAMADRAKASFAPLFWNPVNNCLDDVAGDPSVRPNQLFAVSLTHTMLPEDMARAVLAVAREDLLTPAGLRTLSPRDPRHQSSYRGGVRERDGAYHQGTVWLWLLGPFFTAYWKVHKGSPEARAWISTWIADFRHRMATQGCVGQLAEVADSAAPHKLGGCFAQAWSVAELLRVERLIARETTTNGTTAGGSPQ